MRQEQSKQQVGCDRIQLWEARAQKLRICHTVILSIGQDDCVRIHEIVPNLKILNLFPSSYDNRDMADSDVNT
ncbi:hypothetical protein LBWT_31470 [Leptolyngbya boryana IAM M-101]|nr:hypothetical protein LBWT_31470 [Leptolyngbya boryana IAM M-101]BAS63541.1 hypothetical protein LBDG_31470 [Leptolyngbya boryana dg5]